MKKFFIISAIALFIGTMFGCSGCKKVDNTTEEEENVIIDNDTTLVVGDLNVEHCISSDKEYVFLNYSEDYSWFETSIVLRDFLDEECDGTIVELNDVYQIVTKKDEGYDTKVIMFNYSNNGDSVNEYTGFWFGDFPLNDCSVNLTFEEAFEKAMESNYPKPHSRQVVLRKQVGPRYCNPQYIFGNQLSQLYVDAVNGNVLDKNPVFDGFNYKFPEVK